jgi:hypothetical protein
VIKELALRTVRWYRPERMSEAGNRFIDDTCHEAFTKQWTSYTTNLELIPISKDREGDYRTLEIVTHKTNREKSIDSP